jgi:hypothetical protein
MGNLCTCRRQGRQWVVNTARARQIQAGNLNLIPLRDMPCMLANSCEEKDRTDLLCNADRYLVFVIASVQVNPSACFWLQDSRIRVGRSVDVISLSMPKSSAWGANSSTDLESPGVRYERPLAKH